MIIPPAHDGERGPAPPGWGAIILLIVFAIVLLGSSLVDCARRRAARALVAKPAPRTTMLLSPAVRARLRPRMRRHAQAMTALTDAVVSLDDARVIRAVGAVLDDPDAARPLSSQAAILEAELPSHFGELEAALAANARALRDAARAHDDEALAQADADLAWTCARCHADFAGP